MNIKNLVTFKDSEDNYLPNDPRIPSNVCSDCGRTDCNQIQDPCTSCGFPHCENDPNCPDYRNGDDYPLDESDSLDIDMENSWDDDNDGIYTKSWNDVDKDDPAGTTPVQDPNDCQHGPSDPDDDDCDASTPLADSDDEDTETSSPINWDDLNNEAKKKEEKKPTNGHMLSDLEKMVKENKSKLPGEPCVRCKKPMGSVGGETFCGPCEVELEKK